MMKKVDAEHRFVLTVKRLNLTNLLVVLACAFLVALPAAVGAQSSVRDITLDLTQKSKLTLRLADKTASQTCRPVALKPPTDASAGSVSKANTKPREKLEPEPVVVSLKDGLVFISSKPASAGDLIKSGSVLTTPENSAAVLLMSDGSTLRMRPNSRLEVLDLSSSKNGAITQRNLVLTSGRIEADIEPSSKLRQTRVRVRAGRLLMMVRGTEFRVSVGGGGKIISEVVSGKVQVYYPPNQCGVSDSVVLKSGNAIVATSTGIGLESLPAAPELADPITTAAGQTQIAMPVASGVATYRVVIVGGVDSQILRVEELSAGGVWVTPVLPPGEYKVEIRGVSASGVEGVPTKVSISASRVKDPLPLSTTITLTKTELGLRVSWLPVAGATTYEVEVLSLDSLAEKPQRYLVGGVDSLIHIEPSPPPKLYRVKVRPLAGELRGEESERIGPDPAE